MNPREAVERLLPFLGNRIKQRPKAIASRWYPLQRGAPAVGGAVMASGTLYFHAFWLEQTITISDLGARITTLAASGNIKVAIYAGDPATMKPTGLPVAESGALSTAAAAVVSSDISGADKVLAPGLYFMASMADTTAGGTVVVQSTSNASSFTAWLTGATTLALASSGTATNNVALTIANTYANGFPDMTLAAPTEVNTSIGAYVYAKIAA